MLTRGHTTGGHVRYLSFQAKTVTWQCRSVVQRRKWHAETPQGWKRCQLVLLPLDVRQPITITSRFLHAGIMCGHPVSSSFSTHSATSTLASIWAYTMTSHKLVSSCICNFSLWFQASYHLLGSLSIGRTYIETRILLHGHNSLVVQLEEEDYFCKVQSQKFVYVCVSCIWNTELFIVCHSCLYAAARRCFNCNV